MDVVLAQVRTTQNSNRRSAKTGQLPTLSNDVWRPPNPSVLKINIDGAFQLSSKEGSMACLCRDQNGKLIDGFTRGFAASSALQTETRAFTLTLKHMLQQGRAHDPLLIESDCQLLVNAVLDHRSMPWEVRPLLVEAIALLPCFSRLRVQHCRCEANFAAD
ncbi:hypothetical protein ACJRO7_020865 [Eucalyptus globulus]|uniref:RNase H type-1 domain-containing protein n=1 Tax=Eucalyptus globulus TaxID=34317 RepID=A0ABD3KHY7_EUCGL